MLEIIQVNVFWLSFLAVIVSLFAFLLGLWSLLKAQKVSRLSRSFLSGKDGKSLENAILEQTENLKDLDKEIQELFEAVSRVNKIAQYSLHKVGVIRYNPFKDLGGDQSFVIALLDAKNSGLVISSLHTREGTRVYAKPVVQGQSKYSLTEEEKQAIKIASPIKESRV